MRNRLDKLKHLLDYPEDNWFPQEKLRKIAELRYHEGGQFLYDYLDKRLTETKEALLKTQDLEDVFGSMALRERILIYEGLVKLLGRDPIVFEKEEN